MSAFFDLASLVLVPSGYKASKVYAQKPLTTDGQLTFSRASTATRVNSAGLIETVSSNVPRLDYLNSSCPKLLLEPQRTQYCLQPIDLSDGTGWINELNLGTALTYTATNGPSGAGYSTIQGATAAGRVVQATTTALSSATFSVYLRKRSASHTGNIVLSCYTAPVGDSLTITAAQLTSEWKRFSLTVSGGTVAYSDWSVYPYDSVDFDISCVQFENGAYATSFIPATTSTVTRLADACSKTGISSLIGQTEGVLFIDIVLKNNIASVNRVISITESNWLIGGSIRIDIQSTSISVDIVNNSGSVGAVGGNIAVTANTRYKIALAYKQNQLALYVNGTQLGTNTSTGAMPTCSELYLNELGAGFGGPWEAINFNQALLFKTRLTNAQLAELTAL